jgi:hypothetical protein
MATLEQPVKPLPKSYLTDAEREELRHEGASEESILLAEADAASDADDDETTWMWLAKTELSAPALAYLKDVRGAQFIRDMGFLTTEADAAYGPGWLDRE